LRSAAAASVLGAAAAAAPSLDFALAQLPTQQQEQRREQNQQRPQERESSVSSRAWMGEVAARALLASAPRPDLALHFSVGFALAAAAIARADHMYGRDGPRRGLERGEVRGSDGCGGGNGDCDDDSDFFGSGNSSASASSGDAEECRIEEREREASSCADALEGLLVAIMRGPLSDHSPLIRRNGTVWLLCLLVAAAPHLHPSLPVDSSPPCLPSLFYSLMHLSIIPFSE